MTSFFVDIVTKFTGYMTHWMNMNPWKNQTDVINGFDFFRKIEVSVLYEKVCIKLESWVHLVKKYGAARISQVIFQSMVTVMGHTQIKELNTM